MKELEHKLNFSNFGNFSEFANVPHLSEKLILDLTSGLFAANEIVQFQASLPIYKRVISLIDGSYFRSQDVINQYCQVSLEGLVSWIRDLTEKSSFTATFLERVKKNLDFVAQVTIEHEVIINKLFDEIEQINEDMASLKVDQKVDRLFERWEAGVIYEGYPVILQTIFILDDLMRDEVSQKIFSNDVHQKHLLTKIQNFLKKHFGIKPDDILLINNSFSQDISLTKRNIASYLLINDDRPYSLHTLLGEFAEFGREPYWLRDKQIAGEVPVFVKTARFLEKISEEIMFCKIKEGVL